MLFRREKAFLSPTKNNHNEKMNLAVCMCSTTPLSSRNMAIKSVVTSYPLKSGNLRSYGIKWMWEIFTVRPLHFNFFSWTKWGPKTLRVWGIKLILFWAQFVCCLWDSKTHNWLSDMNQDNIMHNFVINKLWYSRANEDLVTSVSLDPCWNSRPSNIVWQWYPSLCITTVFLFRYHIGYFAPTFFSKQKVYRFKSINIWYISISCKLPSTRNTPGRQR